MESKAKILIIDDTIDTVDLLRKRLQADGYETGEAYDGIEGLKKIKSFGPDLVVLDVMMPKLDGFEVCSRLKEDDSTRHIPILLLTAKSEIPDKVKGLDTGADGYITKPFDYKEVSARIRSLLAKDAASKQLAQDEKSTALESLVDEISHEIRNPLVAIGGFARRIQKNLGKDDPNRKYLEVILTNVEVLEKMVKELVGLKSAALSFMEPSDINALVRESIELNHPKIKEKNIFLRTSFMENPPIISADRENFTRALSNIIENAVEAMSGDERILEITTQVMDKDFIIRVSDTGTGISRDRLKNIYDPFFSSKIYGPGLGLTFTLKTIQNHKGTITVESEKGRGTVFNIRIPVRF